MELSCKNEYALLALMQLAANYSRGEPLQIRQISAQQEIPDRYLEQLLALLRRGGLIKSQRGAKGGYVLAREPWKISLWEVAACLDGSEPATAEALPRTSESAVIREVWQASSQAAQAVLQRHTLQDLCDQRDARQQLDIMYYI